MKIVINKCFGGFGLSAKAIARLAELQGKTAYFFNQSGWGTNAKYTPVALEDIGRRDFVVAFDSPNVPVHSRDFNSWYSEHTLTSRPSDRTDPLLIQVVTELGEDADGPHAALRIIEIPDGVNWKIDDYDGQESVEEVHRSWG